MGLGREGKGWKGNRWDGGRAMGDAARPQLDGSAARAEAGPAGYTATPAAPSEGTHVGSGRTIPIVSAPPSDENWAETPWHIVGEGRWAGKPPRGAGVLAFQSSVDMKGPLVCVVEKTDKKKGFPKGGRHGRIDRSNNWNGETIICGAKREWREETGISVGRLEFCRGVSVDDPFIGTRYLVATCQQANVGGGQPDDGVASWAPPCEDPSDHDPIVKAQWLPVCDLLNGRFQLSEARYTVLQSAIAHMVEGMDGEHTGPDALCVLLGQKLAQLAEKNIAPAPKAVTLTDSEKDVMKLLKKLREIMKLEERAASGEVLDANQQEKRASQCHLLQELATTSARLPANSDVKSKAQDMLAASGQS